MSASNPWIQQDAILLCRAVEQLAPDFGAHVALTGGLLYRDGERKDCDLIFYRIRQSDTIDVDGLFAALARLGIERTMGRSDDWCIKARTRGGKLIDCLFPENKSGSYAANSED